MGINLILCTLKIILFNIQSVQNFHCCWNVVNYNFIFNKFLTLSLNVVFRSKCIFQAQFDGTLPSWNYISFCILRNILSNHPGEKNYNKLYLLKNRQNTKLKNKFLLEFSLLKYFKLMFYYENKAIFVPFKFFVHFKSSMLLVNKRWIKLVFY